MRVTQGPGSGSRHSAVAFLWVANSPPRIPGFHFQLPPAVLWASPVKNASTELSMLPSNLLFLRAFLTSISGYGLSQSCHFSTASLSIPTKAASFCRLHPPLVLNLDLCHNLQSDFLSQCLTPLSTTLHLACWIWSLNGNLDSANLWLLKNPSVIVHKAKLLNRVHKIQNLIWLYPPLMWNFLHFCLLPCLAFGALFLYSLLLHCLLFSSFLPSLLLCRVPFSYRVTISLVSYLSIFQTLCRLGLSLCPCLLWTCLFHRTLTSPESYSLRGGYILII